MRCPKCATLSPVFRNDEYRTLYRCPKCRSRFTALNRHYLEQEAAAESVRAPSYFVWAHQDKSEALTDALNTKYRQVGTYQRRGLKFILTDSDIRGKQFHMEQARKMGCRRFFVYPHAAPPSLYRKIRVCHTGSETSRIPCPKQCGSFQSKRPRFSCSGAACPPSS